MKAVHIDFVVLCNIINPGLMWTRVTMQRNKHTCVSMEHTYIFCFNKLEIKCLFFTPEFATREIASHHILKITYT